MGEKQPEISFGQAKARGIIFSWSLVGRKQGNMLLSLVGDSPKGTVLVLMQIVFRIVCLFPKKNFSKNKEHFGNFSTILVFCYKIFKVASGRERVDRSKQPSIILLKAVNFHSLGYSFRNWNSIFGIQWPL